MSIVSLGLNYSTRQLLLPPADEDAVAASILKSLAGHAEALASLNSAATLGLAFRGEIKRRVRDMGDPRSAGWTILVNGQDPQKDDLLAALEPLARRRGMVDPARPLIYTAGTLDDWLEWLRDNLSSLGKHEKPRYILIAGGPEQVPFLFQSMLHAVASTGRVAFDSVADLKTYVEKVLRLEDAAAPSVERQTVFFAPDGGPADPTYYSCRYLARPLAEEVENEIGFPVRLLAGKEASKARLQEALYGARPALVFLASHGLGAPQLPLEQQKQLNGAVCCQAEASAGDWLFTAADVPANAPFLEGAAVFQFACFGYGTPAESDFAHWCPEFEARNSSEDFVAALPKRLLAHPAGPITYVGHVDMALLSGIADPANPVPALGERWSDRVAPFVTAVRRLLAVEPVSLAMEDMYGYYSATNAQLATTYNLMQKGKFVISDDIQTRLVDLFLLRNDAQNYLVFGDPAACLRIPE